jgi:hypothetical protein
VTALNTLLSLVNDDFHTVEDAFLQLLFLPGHLDFLLLLLEEGYLQVLLEDHDLTGNLLLQLLVLLVKVLPRCLPHLGFSLDLPVSLEAREVRTLFTHLHYHSSLVLLTCLGAPSIGTSNRELVLDLSRM